MWFHTVLGQTVSVTGAPGQIKGTTVEHPESRARGHIQLVNKVDKKILKCCVEQKPKHQTEKALAGLESKGVITQGYRSHVGLFVVWS